MEQIDKMYGEEIHDSKRNRVMDDNILIRDYLYGCRREYYVNEKGERNGVYKMWWENGNLWIECDYKDGREHGRFSQYYPDGVLWMRMYYS
jgi:antitoxin component YwqK of YwqJK toxin-antitoxin module